MAENPACAECQTKHGPFVEKFNEWSWHAPNHGTPLGSMRPADAARAAWDYQQSRIDALKADAARALGLMASVEDGGWEEGADIILRMVGRPTLADLIASCEPKQIHEIAAGPNRPFGGKR